jgi:hypothetical protein
MTDCASRWIQTRSRRRWRYLNDKAFRDGCGGRREKSRGRAPTVQNNNGALRHPALAYLRSSDGGTNALCVPKRTTAGSRCQQQWPLSYSPFLLCTRLCTNKLPAKMLSHTIPCPLLHSLQRKQPEKIGEV